MMNLKLSESEANSALWLKIKAHLEQRLERHRIRNDGNLPPDATANLRGRIAEAKYLLALDQPNPAIEVDAGDIE